MKEDWTDQLRQRLEGHKAEPPAGLWEDISKQMGFQTEPVRQPAVIGWHRWAIAAILLALVGLFTVYHFDNHHDNRIHNVIQQKQPLSVVHQTQKADDAVCQNLRAEEMARPSHSLRQDKSETILQDTALTEHQQPVPQDQVTEQQQDHVEGHQQSLRLTPNKDSGPILKSSSAKWSLGVNASGGLLAARTFGRTDMISNVKAQMANSHYEQEQSSQHEEQTGALVNHRLPIRLGLSIQYQLNNRLSLFSGLNYTYLYSEFSSNLYKNVSLTQKLSYLGVPLGISWNLWSTSRFSFYVSGQVMLEKCLNEKPWQWSLGAALGAEYGITRQFGLYLEPSLGYFFNDGTQLEHYYKEHRFAPSIEFGLRMYLNK